MILCLIGMVALTFATLAARGAGGSRNMMMLVGLQMAVGAALLLIPAVLMEWGRPVEWSAGLVWAFAYTVIAPGIGATWLWFRLVNRIGAVRAATFHFLSPIFGVGIAAALLGERFGVSDVIGALIVAAGILMVQLAKLPAAAPQPSIPAARASRVGTESAAPIRRWRRFAACLRRRTGKGWRSAGPRPRGGCPAASSACPAPRPAAGSRCRSRERSPPARMLDLEEIQDRHRLQHPLIPAEPA